MMVDEIREAVTGAEQRAAAAGTPVTHRLVVPADLRSGDTADGGSLVFRGHASVFGQLSHDLGGFRERVQRGAFRKVLDANADVVALINHAPNLVLARTRSGTLQLREDPRGLHAWIDAADTTYARDLRVSVDRGDIDSMSFGFTVKHDKWTQDTDGQVIRTITEIGELLDVSIVTFPAYPQTDVRSAVAGDGEAPDEELDTACVVAGEGGTPTDLDPDVGAEETARNLSAARRRRLRMRELGVVLPPPAAREDRDIGALGERVTPRQRAIYEALEQVAGTFGMFDQSTGPDGAHYVDGSGNPFVPDGLACRNCAFFVGGGGCEVVSGVVDPDGVCKLWVIPGDLIAAQSAPRPMTSPGG